MCTNWIYAAHPSSPKDGSQRKCGRPKLYLTTEVPEERRTLKRLRNAARRDPGMVSQIVICCLRVSRDGSTSDFLVQFYCDGTEVDITSAVGPIVRVLI